MKNERLGTIGVIVAGALGVLSLWAPAAQANQPEELVRWYGDASSATGNGVSSGECDVNGDGFDDSIVGAWFWDKPPLNNTGAAYVLFGKENPAGGDLNNPAAVGAVRIDGPAAGRSVGISVVCAGDVNGDDFDDFLIADYQANQAYVILGADDFGPLDLEVLGDRGYVIKGPTSASFSFGSYKAGDLNGDGLGDIGISAVVADTRGRNNNGAIYVVAGKEDVADIDVTDPNPGELLLQIDGAVAEDRLGSAAPAGDVDGDGTDDLLIGAYTSNPYPTALEVPGTAWVISGAARGAIDLAALDPEDGYAIFGPDRQRDRFGISVAGAGDVNGDDLADLLVGGDGVYNAATGPRNGGAWVIYGSETHQTVFTDASGDDPGVFTCADAEYVPGANCAAPTERGYWIKGADSDPGTASESTGYALDSIGDVNADGIPDAAIGAYGYDPQNPESPGTTMAGAGAVWVVYGQEGNGTIDLAAITEAQGYRIDGRRAGDRFGRAVGALGDFDGNGAPDFSAGGDFSQRPLPPGTPRTQAGEVTIALMGTFETSASVNASPNPVKVGNEVSLTATVSNEAGTGGVSSGTVEFTAGGTAIAGCEEQPVSEGQATCVTSFSQIGTVSIDASYTGGGTFAASEADATNLVVEAAPVAPTITPAESPLEIGADRSAVVATIDCGPGGDCTVSAANRDVRFGKTKRKASVEAPATVAEGTSAEVVIELSRRAQTRLDKRNGFVAIEIEVSSPEGGSTSDRFALELTDSEN